MFKGMMKVVLAVMCFVGMLDEALAADSEKAQVFVQK
jgi:hypothetical protein